MKGLRHVADFVTGTRRSPSGPSRRPPFLLKYRSSVFFITLVVALAVFTDIFLYGLIVPVIPFALTVQVGVDPSAVQTWNAILLACYNVALFIGSPIFGLFADRTSSRRIPFLIGLLALAGSTLLLCLGRSIALLVLGRILQGLSAAVCWSVGLALLADTMGRNIGVAMGWVAWAMSAALLVSPVIGGAVYHAAGYYAVYYVAFGIIVCDILLRLILIEKKVARQWIGEDELRAAPSGDNAGEEAGQGETETKEDDSIANPVEAPPIAPLTTAVVPRSQPAGSPIAERSAAAPEVRKAVHPLLILIRSRRMLAALSGTVMMAAVMFAVDTVVPLFVHDTFHWTSTAAGLIFFCIFLPGFLSPLVGVLADRYGSKWPALAGFVCSVPLLVCLRFVTRDTMPQKVLFGALLALLGVALTLSNVPLAAEITYAIEEREERTPGIWGVNGVNGIAYGLFTTAFALGGVIGSFASGYLVAGPGWGTFTWAFAIWCSAGAVVAFLWVGGPRPKLPSGS